jgi:hypothetical protein
MCKVSYYLSDDRTVVGKIPIFVVCEQIEHFFIWECVRNKKKFQNRFLRDWYRILKTAK